MILLYMLQILQFFLDKETYSVMFPNRQITSIPNFKVARYSFSGSIAPKSERKLRRHKQRFGKINTTVVLDKEENWL